MRYVASAADKPNFESSVLHSANDGCWQLLRILRNIAQHQHHAEPARAMQGLEALQLQRLELVAGAKDQAGQR